MGWFFSDVDDEISSETANATLAHLKGGFNIGELSVRLVSFSCAFRE
jgi:hypothetical protein